MTNEELVKQIPQLAQRQDSTTDQLLTMLAVANRLGCYDAADVIKRLLTEKPRAR